MTGTYIYSLDRKGRIVLPMAFRAELGAPAAPVVVTRSPGRRLVVLSQETWRRYVDCGGQEPVFRDFYLSGAADCWMDRNSGRILIPHALREGAELRPSMDVAISGLGQVVVLMDRGRWDSQLVMQEARLLAAALRPQHRAPYEAGRRALARRAA